METLKRQILQKIYALNRPLLSYFGMLDYMARAYGTDKHSHGYTKHYQEHLAPLRKRKIKLLEIGVGGYNRPGEGGPSLRMWKDYFPRGEILAIDIHDKRELEQPRIQIFQGDQSDPTFLDDFGSRWGPFDVVIDDGSHVSSHVITSFRALYPHVKPGGYYVTEDLFFSYDPSLGGSATEMNSPSTSLGMLKSLVDELHWKYIPGRVPESFGDSITAIFFYPKICFIQKGDNSAIDTQVAGYYDSARSQGESIRDTTQIGAEIAAHDVVPTQLNN